jgi:hypothetical protein
MAPNFLIVGPPKCASTSIHFYFSQHPEIFMSPIKETNFFNNDYERGISFYEHYFNKAGTAKAIGEATPSYCFLPFACDRIKKNYPDIKLILCIRNPIERAFSHWMMFWTRGVEKACFREATEINLKQLSYIDFAGEEGARLWKNRGKNISKGEKWPRIYLQAGMYSDIIKRLQLQFGENDLHYYFMDDLKNDFDNTLKKMFAFLGVNESFKVFSMQEKNVYQDRKLNRIANKVLGVKNARMIGKIISPSVKAMLAKKRHDIREAPQLQLEDKKFLWNVFKHDIASLEQMTRRNLSHWNPL